MAEIAYSTEESPHTLSVGLSARRVSLCELLDRVLNKGAVLTGELTISVANIELLYIGLSLVISSVETLIDAMEWNYGDTESEGVGG